MRSLIESSAIVEVLIPARDYKNRHASILLVLEAAVDAFTKTA